MQTHHTAFQAAFSVRPSVCLSVCLSVCHDTALIDTQTRHTAFQAALLFLVHFLVCSGHVSCVWKNSRHIASRRVPASGTVLAVRCDEQVPSVRQFAPLERSPTWQTVLTVRAFDAQALSAAPGRQAAAPTTSPRQSAHCLLMAHSSLSASSVQQLMAAPSPASVRSTSTQTGQAMLPGHEGLHASTSQK
jgi:hypothetical protein